MKRSVTALVLLVLVSFAAGAQAPTIPELKGKNLEITATLTTPGKDSPSPTTQPQQLSNSLRLK